jgi:outer membrane protein assembly factor BamA
MILEFRIAAALFITSLCFTIPVPAFSQTMLPGGGKDSNPVQYSIMPVAGYTSDTGLFGGGLFQRINYGQDRRNPFLSILKADVIGSFRGEFQGQIVYEHTNWMDRDLRSRVSLSLFRSEISNFFGLGNQSSFSDELYDENYFFYLNRNVTLGWRVRKTIAEYGFEGELDLFTEIKVDYHNTSALNENTSFAEYQLQGNGSSGWTNMAGFGLIADDRNSEFNPTEGYRYEAGVSLSNSLLASEYNFAMIWGELRNYVEIFRNVVIAHKLRGELTTGDAPFWKFSTLGNSDGLRGYHLDRFRGERSILNIFEVRTWLFSILDDQVRFGGQLFWDSGRVFSSNDSSSIFDNWKHTYGAGGAISLFNPDFIIRGDLGFSDETFRIYAGIGYIF